MSEPLNWEAQGYAALVSVVREYLSSTDNNLHMALQAAETLRRLLGNKNQAKPLIHYLPAFAAIRIGGEYREKALDELRTAIISNGGRGLLAATDIVEGIARGEIYTDVENILREMDLAGLEPEAKIFGALLRSERLQKMHQENLFLVARALLAEMPAEFLNNLTELAEIGQYDEIGIRVEKWLKDKTLKNVNRALEEGIVSFSELTND